MYLGLFQLISSDHTHVFVSQGSISHIVNMLKENESSTPVTLIGMPQRFYIDIVN